jgi:hypothetical protein
MIAGLFVLMLTVADTGRIDRATSDTIPVAHLASADSVAAPPFSLAPRLDNLALPESLRMPAFAADTLIKKKRKLVEYSDWYGRRLTLHRTLSWTMIPLFAVSYYTGNRLLNDGRPNSPYWVRAAHPYAATGAAAVFGVNTITGVWNLWDARHDPEGRTRRIIHSVLFIVADAGFAYAGSIGEQARDDGRIRSRHRTIALSSMGVSTASWIYMLLTK